MPTTPAARPPIFSHITPPLRSLRLCGALLLLSLSACTSTPPTTTSTFTTKPPPSPTPLPQSPIARPADPDATLTSRVVVSLVELGDAPYDGQVPPLVSPDGRFIAVELGQPPSWPTLLADPASGVPSATRVAAYSLANPTDKSPASVSLIPWPDAPPPGLLLGRSCDTAGFLVESPQPDGSRWIGKVIWVTGRLEWLVRDHHTNSHASLGPTGELAYTRRADNSPRSELVFRSAAGQSALHAPAGVSMLFPLFGPTADCVYAFALSDTGDAEIRALSPAGAAAGALSIAARRALSTDATPAALYQCVAGVQTPIVVPPPSASPDLSRPHDPADPALRSRVLFVHPALRRVVVFDRATASLLPLAPASFAAVPVIEDARPGYLAAGPQGLRFYPDSPRRPPAADSGVAVVAQPLLPRATFDPAWPYTLIGPAGSPSSPHLRLYKMTLGEP